MNGIELIKTIKDIAIQLNPCNSTFDGSVYDNWNNGEIKYGSINVDIERVTLGGQLCTYSVILYYGDRLLQDKSNSNEIITDGVNSLQSVVNVLSNIDYIQVSDSIEYIPFEQQFADYLAGVYCRLDISTPSEIGLCNMDNFEYTDEKDKIIEQLMEKIDEYREKDSQLTILLSQILYKLNGGSSNG
jgi:hypothetical protein